MAAVARRASAPAEPSAAALEKSSASSIRCAGHPIVRLTLPPAGRRTRPRLAAPLVYASVLQYWLRSSRRRSVYSSNACVNTVPTHRWRRIARARARRARRAGVISEIDVAFFPLEEVFCLHTFVIGLAPNG